MSSEKKRKNQSRQDERPSKKLQPNETVEVRYTNGPEVTKPVIVCSPGISLPRDVHFRSYSKKSKISSDELILHSSDHPTIDYNAAQRHASKYEHFKHYIAVFDQRSQRLEVTDAKYLTVRREVRQRDSQTQENEKDDTTTAANYSSRAALTEVFGTKKSKKAVQSMAENRQLAQGNESGSIADAMMATMMDEEGNRDAETSRDHKPLPKANLATNDIEEVYPLDELVFPKPVNSTLHLLHPVKWIQRLRSNQEISGLRSRFVANRVGYIGKALITSSETSDEKLTQFMRLLRYIELLIEINNFLTRLGPRKFAPSVEKWPNTALSENTPPAIINPIVNHFLPDKMVTSRSLTLLRTTILTLALHIPPPSLQAGSDVLITEPTDLALDLALEIAEVRKLYRELGCRVEGAKENELAKWKLEKIYKNRKNEQGQSLPAPMFAKLRIPLEFPKTSRGRPTQRR